MGVAVSQEVVDQAEFPPLARYEITDAEIVEAKRQYAMINFDTKEGYKEGRLAIGWCRNHRVALEKRKDELNEDALAWQRKVLAGYKHFKGLIEEIEKPLKAKKLAADEAKERAAKEKREALWRAEHAKREAEQQAKEAQMRAEREKEETRLKAEREQMERDRAVLAEERREAEEERKAALAAADEVRRKLAEEKRALDAARIKAEQAEAQRQALIKAQQEAAAKADRDRAAAEQFKITEAQRNAAEVARLKGIKPDIQKVLDLAAALRGVVVPQVSSREAQSVVSQAIKVVREVADALEEFGGK